jgi:farnesyl diphosphate synthase
MVLQSARLFKVEEFCALRVAAAVEFLHSYSLIHDDLPAMDNSDTRRGKPSCHIKFGEATAILAGDALQALAFETLASEETHPEPGIRCRLVNALASASGVAGMVAGQMMDLIGETTSLSLDQITRLQNLKTGEMFAFSARAGAILSGASSTEEDNLRKYAERFGLAFQIADDLLDLEGDPSEVGKPTGQDENANKVTFVSVLGADRARNKAEILIEEAVIMLDNWDEEAQALRDLARYVLKRTN